MAKTGSVSEEASQSMAVKSASVVMQLALFHQKFTEQLHVELKPAYRPLVLL